MPHTSINTSHFRLLQITRKEEKHVESLVGFEPWILSSYGFLEHIA